MRRLRRREPMGWGWRLGSFVPTVIWVVLTVLIAPDLAAWQLFLLALTFWFAFCLEQELREEGRRARAERAMEHAPTLRATVDVLTRAAQELRDIERTADVEREWAKVEERIGRLMPLS